MRTTTRTYSTLGNSYIVNVGGEEYRVNEREFALLKTGMEPQDLELEPIGEDEEAE